MGNVVFSVLRDFDGNPRTMTEPKETEDAEEVGEVVVVAVDNTKHSEYAFDWYASRLHRRSNYVYVIHCQEIEAPSGKHFPQYALPPEEWSKEVNTVPKGGDGVLAKYRRKLQQKEMAGRVYAEQGRPGPTVVGVSDSVGATMIIMGCRGMGVVRRTLVGSISTYVITHSDIPVMVIPSAKPSAFY